MTEAQLHNEIVIGTVLGTNKPFTIDANDVIMGRTFLASVTRYGKSWLNRRIVEQLVGKSPIVIVDIEGEYISLREKFPLFLIIGRDVPLQIETAEFMAETVLKENLSVIIDLSMVDDDVGKEYIAAFVKHFMFLETTLRKPYLFVIEEADEFAPEKGVAKATSLNAIQNLVKKGGKRGVGIIITTHRPAFVSKNVVSQCTTLKVIGRIEWESDLEVLCNFLRVPMNVLVDPEESDGKFHVNTLEVGQFYFAGTAVKENAFVKVGGVQTKHLGATPDLIPPTPKQLSKVVEALQRELPKIIEQKIKPTTKAVEAIREECERKAEEKFKTQLEREKDKVAAQTKGRIAELEDKNRELTQKLDEAARKTSLEGAPITNVFEHPIVRNVMEKLSQRAKDLLIKIEQEPNSSREQLAAFLSVSKDTVKSIVDEINRTFKVTVIIEDGRPVQHKSMLKRLFITDVGKKEIAEMERLNSELSARNTENTNLLENVRVLKSERDSLVAQVKNLPRLEVVEQLKKKIDILELDTKGKSERLKQLQRVVDYFNRNWKVLLGVFEEVNKGLQKLSEQEVVEQPTPENKTATAPSPSPVETHDEAVPKESAGGLEGNVVAMKLTKFLSAHNRVFTLMEIALATGESIEAVKRVLETDLANSVERTAGGVQWKLKSAMENMG